LYMLLLGNVDMRIFEAAMDASVLDGVTSKVGVGTTVVVLGDGGEGWCGGFHNSVYCEGGGGGRTCGGTNGKTLVAVPDPYVSKPQ